MRHHDGVTTTPPGRRVFHSGAALLVVTALSSCSGSSSARYFPGPPALTSRVSIVGEFSFVPRPEPSSTTLLSAAEAWAVMSRGKPIPTIVTPQYGLLTELVSHSTPGTGVPRKRYKGRPVWAFRAQGLCPVDDALGAASPPPAHLCVDWYLLDASTGTLLAEPIQNVRSVSG